MNYISILTETVGIVKFRFNALHKQRIRILAPALARGLLNEVKLGESLRHNAFTPPVMAIAMPPPS